MSDGCPFHAGCGCSKIKWNVKMGAANLPCPFQGRTSRRTFWTPESREKRSESYSNISIRVAAAIGCSSCGN